MLYQLLKSIIGKSKPAPSPARVMSSLNEAASAEIAGMDLERAAAALAARFARGETAPANDCLLGTILLRLGRADEARDVFAVSRTRHQPNPFISHCKVGEAQARARLLQARGARAPLRPLPAEARGRKVSVVICSVRPERFARVTAHYRELLREVPHEIVGIHDARSLCEGYNRGLRESRGDWVVFSHDDVEVVSNDFAAKLCESLAQADVVGVAGTTRLTGAYWGDSGPRYKRGQTSHPPRNAGADGQASARHVLVFGIDGRTTAGIEALDGLMFAARREVAEKVGFDEERFDGWHLYDVDFTFSAACAGHRLAVRSDLLVHHDSLGSYDAVWQRYAERFTQKHRGRLRPRPPASTPTVLVKIDSPEEWRLLAEELLAVAAESGAIVAVGPEALTAGAPGAA